MSSANTQLGGAIEAVKAELAREIVDEQWARNPHYVDRYGELGHAKCVQDVTYNLSYLSQAIASNSLPLFSSYIQWVKAVFEGLKIPTRELSESLSITAETLRVRFPDAEAVISKFIDLGLNCMADAPQNVPTFMDGSGQLSELAREYLAALRNGDRATASRLILQSVAKGTSVKDIYLKVFEPAQHEIGRLWQINEMTVAQEHFCTAATQLVMSQLYSEIFNTTRIGRRMVATGVAGELHEIGLRMVADFFEMDGWDTYYLGSNMPGTQIVQCLEEHNADLLAISVTMTFHIPLVSGLIERVRAADPGGTTKILVGGYPFMIEPELWKHVGADGFATNAANAIEAARLLLA